MNRYIVSYAVLCCILLGLISCASHSTDGEEEEILSPIILPEESLYQSAEEAYKTNQYGIAEEEYNKALSIPSLPTSQRAISYVRLAYIATTRTDYNSALSYLLQAVTLQPNLVQEKEWYSLFEQSVLFLGNTKALDAVFSVLQVEGSMQYEVGRIYIAGAYLLWIDGKIGDALSLAKDAWEFAKTEGERAVLEETAYAYLQATNASTKEVLFDTVTNENRMSFPYNVFYLEKAIQYARQENRTLRTQGISMLEYLRKNHAFLNTKLIPNANTPPARKGIAQGPPQKEQNIVFLLPLSSAKYKRFTQQIVNGALISQQMLRNVHSGIRVHYINTELKGWLRKLQQFPAGTIVGGPLRQSTFETIRKSGVYNKYIFFTFLQNLPNGVEGVHAWRFYNSPQDQIDALYRFGSALGITSYGVLYPKDEYGSKMANLFRNTASRYRSSVIRMQSYGSKESQWTNDVARYLKTRFINKQPIPEVSFRATFVPDSFKNATILIPNLFYNGEQRQVIMGTSLWEEQGSHTYTKDTFEFAVYPTPFNPSTHDTYTKELQRRLTAQSKGKVTRWSALGFDFVRFAYTMNKVALRTAPEINSYLSRERGMKWVMAPLRWSSKGICRQLLFIVTPEGEGARLVDMKTFTRKLDRMYKMQDNRIKILLEETK